MMCGGWLIFLPFIAAAGYVGAQAEIVKARCSRNGQVRVSCDLPCHRRLPVFVLS
jgi:hypothetical protein